MNQIYCLYGLDQKSIIKKRNEIIKEKNIDEFNISIFDMDNVSIEQALQDAYSIPFLGDFRAVVLKNSRFLSASKAKNDDEEDKEDKKDDKKEDLNKLIDYLNNPQETTILIIECPFEKLDSKKNIVKKIKDMKIDIEFKPMDQAEAAVYITKYLKDKGYQIDFSAKDELVKRISDDPSSFENELEKISLYLDKDKKITLDIVKNLITETVNPNIFNLMNAIMNKDSKTALNTYYELIEQGNDPIYVQSFVIKRFSQLLYAKEIASTGGKQVDIQELLKISPGQAYYLKEDASKISYQKISRVLNELKELDYATKSSFKYGSDQLLGFELFLMKIK